MYSHFKGIITDIENSNIVLEVNNIGYEFLVSHPNDFVIGKEYVIYCSQIIREDETYLVGFSSKLEKKAFLALTSVKGIGPRSAISALSATSPELLFDAIDANNILFLRKLPSIGPKAANQIILDLKGHLSEKQINKCISLYDEVKEGLKSLGFKNKEIDNVLLNINIPNADNETIMVEALKRLGKK